MLASSPQTTDVLDVQQLWSFVFGQQEQFLFSYKGPLNTP